MFVYCFQQKYHLVCLLSRAFCSFIKQVRVGILLGTKIIISSGSIYLLLAQRASILFRWEGRNLKFFKKPFKLQIFHPKSNKKKVILSLFSKKQNLIFAKWLLCTRECNFSMGSIFGKDFAQAQVYAVNCTSAKGGNILKSDIFQHLKKISLWHFEDNNALHYLYVLELVIPVQTSKTIVLFYTYFYWPWPLSRLGFKWSPREFNGTPLSVNNGTPLTSEVSTWSLHIDSTCLKQTVNKLTRFIRYF